MNARRIMQQAVIVTYLFVTASAFLFTMTRIRNPLIPRQVFLYSYGMMAPYQSDDEWNYEIVAEGLKDGAWVPVDLNAYYPYARGEGVIRRLLGTYEKLFSKEERKARFTDLAILLLEHEREQGRAYEAMRLYAERWNRSPAGYDYLRRPEMIEREILADVR